MIRMLHTADWHLGQTFFGFDRTEEHQDFLDWLAEEIRLKEIDALIVAGDIFDVSNPSAASQRMYYQFIHKVTAENPNLQIVIVAGNHDSAARLEAPLPLLQAMRTEVKGVVRKGKDGEIDFDHLTVELKNRQGETEVLCMAVLFCVRAIIPQCRQTAILMRRECASFISVSSVCCAIAGKRIRLLLQSGIYRRRDRRLPKKIIANGR